MLFEHSPHNIGIIQLDADNFILFLIEKIHPFSALTIFVHLCTLCGVRVSGIV